VITAPLLANPVPSSEELYAVDSPYFDSPSADAELDLLHFMLVQRTFKFEASACGYPLPCRGLGKPDQRDCGRHHAKAHPRVAERPRWPSN
jgi:hypothetical protein